MSEFSMEKLAPLITEVVGEGGEFRLYPKGTSMRPLLRQGIDSVALASLNRSPKRGDILLYRRENGQYVLHRLMRRAKNGDLCFSGDNHMALEHGIAETQVLAVVTAIFRGEKRRSAKGVFMSCYGRLMTVNAFKRLFFVARHIRARLIRGIRKKG